MTHLNPIIRRGRRATRLLARHPVDDGWDILIINPPTAERLGDPTQKPEALLTQIIEAS
jgi:hypothetical protein